MNERTEKKTCKQFYLNDKYWNCRRSSDSPFNFSIFSAKTKISIRVNVQNDGRLTKKKENGKKKKLNTKN